MSTIWQESRQRRSAARASAQQQARTPGGHAAHTDGTVSTVSARESIAYIQANRGVTFRGRPGRGRGLPITTPYGRPGMWS